MRDSTRSHIKMVRNAKYAMCKVYIQHILNQFQFILYNK